MNHKERREHKGFKSTPLSLRSLRPLRLKNLLFRSKINNQQSSFVNQTLFVQGCFWHGHENGPVFRIPKSRRAFWKAKIQGNQARDL